MAKRLLTPGSATVRFALVISLALSAVVSSRSGVASSASPPQFERISAFFSNEVASGRLPGAVILIQQRGSPVYFKCFGVRDVATGAPMTADTIFAIYSMTKPITSLAAMMLVDAGKLSLDDPVAKYIPSFAHVRVALEATDTDGRPALNLVEADRPVTITDLLRHTSGIGYEDIGGELIRQAYMRARLLDGQFDNAAFAERIAKLPLGRQPGTLWRYGHSTDVLGRVIEVVTGQPLYQVFRQQIFDPLGMTGTKFVLDTDAERARMAEPLPGDRVLRNSERQRRARPEWQSGGGGLVSTIADYARFAQMLLNGGELDGRRYLSPASLKIMTTDQIGPTSGVARDFFYYPGDGFGYGYGVAVRTGPGNARPPPPGSIGELKWDSGSGTYFGVDPKLDMIYLMMQQTETERGRITRAFKQLVYDAFAVDGSGSAGAVMPAAMAGDPEPAAASAGASTCSPSSR
jgi:CubicO group peptidase (beta-lactamase class C family)